jgi:hypothetical protein
MFPPVSPLADSSTQAPSRIGDPDNFPSESDAFMSRYETFRQQSNTLALYLNSAPVNYYNWGLISDTNPAPLVIPLFPELPSSQIDPGQLFAAKADAQISAMYRLTGDQNSVGTLVDILTAFTEATSLIADPERPVIGSVPEPPSRLNSVEQLEINAQNFHASVASYGNAISHLATFLYNKVVGGEDYGVIGQPVTQSEDFGVLP